MDNGTLAPDSGGKPKNRWRLLGWTILVLLALAMVFYRPIMLGLVHLAVRIAEKNAHLEIRYRLAGSFINSFELTNLEINPLVPGPLEKLTLKHFAARYHPIDGLIHGWPALIESVELRDLELLVDAAHPQTAQARRKRLQKTTSNWLLLFPKRIDLRGVNIRIKTLHTPFEIANANLTLLPEQTGIFSVDRIVIPGYRTFTDWRANTSYENRNFILKNLSIAPDLTVDRLQIDGAGVAAGDLNTRLSAKAFDGYLEATFAIANLGHSNDLNATLNSEAVDLEKLSHFFNPALAVSGKIESLRFTLNGPAENPAAWNGALEVHLAKPTLLPFRFETGSVHASLRDGNFTISKTALLQGDQWITLEGSGRLPGRSLSTRPFATELTLAASLPDLGHLFEEAAGTAVMQGRIQVSAGKISANLTSQLTSARIPNLLLDSANVTAQFTKTGAPRIDWRRPWWESSKGSLQLNASTITAMGCLLDRADLTIHTTNETATIDSLAVSRGSNSFRAGGTFTFLEKPRGPLPGALDLNLELDAPKLSEVANNPATPVVAGAARCSGQLSWTDKQPVGSLQFKGTDLQLNGVALGLLNIKLQTENGIAQVQDLTLDLPGSGFIQGTGTFRLNDKDHYFGQLSIRLDDLAHFKPWFHTVMGDTRIAGNLALDWRGSGDVGPRRHEGQVSLLVKDGIFAAVEGIRLNTFGYYTPEQGEFPNIDLATSKGNLSATASYFEKLLKIENIHLSQNQEMRLSGNISLPIDLAQLTNRTELFPLDKPLTIDLSGQNVKLGGLLVDLGVLPPETGLLNLAIRARGTLRNPDALISLKGTNLKSDRFKQIQPISTELNLAIAGQRANLTGSVREPSLEPVTLSGSIPVDLAKIVQSGKFDASAPLQARAAMAPASLAFATRYFPFLRTLDGTLGFNVEMEGTLEKPIYRGNLKASAQTLRFRSNSLPSVRDFSLDLGFRDQLLTINQFKGDLAGGPFSAKGNVNLSKLVEPVLNLNLQGRSILVVRNDSLVVRSDVDLAVKGPLATASVTGTVGITDSRFFREIDILPINLPGRPVPAIRDRRPTLSITNPPVRDWKFDVAIKTLDPFRVTGNLANGESIVDLRLGGTGLAPTLDGNVQVTELKASLPFSRLNIKYGSIYFSKDLPPLNPILDLHGESKVRDYEIDAYIWGDLVKPQTLFLSQPPLSSEDILILLATGATQSEIAQNPQLLAGRAGWLFLQKHYNKIFRRKQSFEQDSLADRLDVQIGNIDPKTGRESASARLRLSDRWQVIADFDVTGGVRGQVRYLLRFK